MSFSERHKEGAAGTTGCYGTSLSKFGLPLDKYFDICGWGATSSIGGRDIKALETLRFLGATSNGCRIRIKFKRYLIPPRPWGSEILSIFPYHKECCKVPGIQVSVNSISCNYIIRWNLSSVNNLFFRNTTFPFFH